MATKLDKNFGLGNSYKNVKLVKSAIKKVDTSVEEEVSDKVTTEQMNNAIARAVANKSAIYEINDINLGSEYSAELFEGIKPGDIILDIPSDQLFIVLSTDDMNIYLKGINYNYEPVSVDLDYDSENEKYTVTKFDALEVGSKLYKHTISFSYEGYTTRTTLISNDNTPLTNAPQYNTVSIHPLGFSTLSVSGPGTAELNNVIVISFQAANYGSYQYTLAGMKSDSNNQMMYIGKSNINITDVTDTVTPL